MLYSRLFDSKFHRKKVRDKIPLESRHTVDRLPGIKVECGTTSCVIEMIAYKFIGKVFDVHKVPFAAAPLNPGIPPFAQLCVCLLCCVYIGQLVSPPPRLNMTPQEDVTSDSTIRSSSIDSGNFSPTGTVPEQPLNESQAAPRSEMNLNAEEIIRPPDKNSVPEQEPHPQQN